MDLKQRKLIQNSNITLPHFVTGTEPTPGLLPFGDEYTKNLSIIPIDYKSNPPLNPAAAKLNIPKETKPATGGAANVAGKLNAGIQGALGVALMVGQFADASHTDVTSEEMIRNGQTLSIDGELFQKMSVDSEAAMQKDAAKRKANTLALAGSGAATGAAVGSMFGPLGSAIGGIGGAIIGGIGGLFSSKKAKREAEERKRKAEIQVANINGTRFDKAYTAALQKQQARKIGNDDAQELYAARNGYEPLVNPFTNETFRQYKVDTANGMSYDTANAYGKKNEFIWRLGTNQLHKITRGPNDDAKLHLDTGKDVIFTNDILNPFTGKTFAKSALQAKKEGWLSELLNQQIATKQQLGFYNNRKGGQLRHAATGWENASWITGGLLTSLPGVIAGINQIQASKDNISTPRSYVAPNTQKYQNDLDSLDINMFPIYQANREATSISNSKIAQSGGLSAGQQMLGYLTNAMNERDSISKALTNAQMQRNAYRSEAAKVGIDTELRRAAQQQNAQQWDYAQEAAAHNAKVQANQMGWYNISNALGNAYKNMWDYHQFNKMYNIYALDVNSRKPVITNSTNQIKTTDVSNIGKFSSPGLSKPLFDISLQAPKLEKYENTNVWKNYEFGYIGNDLKPIQRIIKTKDDGIFGRNTRKQLIKWQKANKLNPTGIIDLDTYNKMFLN